MKKYFKCGEMILALREEYMECKNLLDELKKYVNVESNNNDYYFTGLLPFDGKPRCSNDKTIRLCIEKNYLELLKKIQYLKYNWYVSFLYSADFDVVKIDDRTYQLKYNDIATPIDDKKYIPKVEITDQVKFSKIIDQIYSSDLMQIKEGCFHINNDLIFLGFDNAHISTPLGGQSFINWNGIDDKFYYSIKKDNSPALIDNIFSLEIPVDRISSDWLKLLEKHENIFDKEILFNTDIDAQSKKGTLQISNIKTNTNCKVVKLLKKQNNNK